MRNGEIIFLLYVNCNLFLSEPLIKMIKMIYTDIKILRIMFVMYNRFFTDINALTGNIHIIR